MNVWQGSRSSGVAKAAALRRPAHSSESGGPDRRRAGQYIFGGSFEKGAQPMLAGEKVMKLIYKSIISVAAAVINIQQTIGPDTSIRPVAAPRGAITFSIFCLRPDFYRRMYRNARRVFVDLFF